IYSPHLTSAKWWAGRLGRAAQIIETPVLDYAMQQYRLFVVIAQAYVVYFAGEFISNLYKQCDAQSSSDDFYCSLIYTGFTVFYQDYLPNPTWEGDNYLLTHPIARYPRLKKVLTSVCNLFALHTIEKELSEFLKQKYLSSKRARMLKIQVSELIKKIRPNAVALFDAFNLPDYLLNSALGRYYGKVYDTMIDWASKEPLNSITFNTSPY
ncbi:5916_t:CDS:2, partial [Racocetra persica]